MRLTEGVFCSALTALSTSRERVRFRDGKKRTENVKFSVLFAVGTNCVRPRAFTERPYDDDFLLVGITCFMEGTPLVWLLFW